MSDSGNHARSSCPFSTESWTTFYVSLMRRYWRLLAAMTLLGLSYQLLANVRLLSVGIVVEVFKAEDPAGIAKDADDGEPATTAGGGESVVVDDRSDDGGSGAVRGRVLEEFERAWELVLPERWPSPTRALGTRDGFQRLILSLVVILAALAIVLAIVYYVREYIAQRLVVRMLVDVRKALFNHLTRQGVSYFSERRMGDLLSRTTNDVDLIQAALRYIYETLFFQPFNIVVSMVIACWAQPFLFVLALPIYVAIALPAIRSGRKVIRHGRGRQEKLGIITEALQQLFSGIRIVKAFGMEEREQEAFKDKNSAFERSFMKMREAKIKARSVQEAIYMVSLALVIGFGGWAVLQRGSLEDDISSYTVFLFALVNMYNPVKAVTKAWQEVQECRPAVERVLEILRQEPLVRDRADAIEFPGLEREIVYDDVRFSYAALDPQGEAAGSRRAIDGVSLTVRRGQSIALVGPSGGGKSTFVDLLARFYEPQSGRILVDGVDYTRYRHASYLREVAIVSQDPFLFHATIRENIRHGRAGASDEDIERAARVANAHDFIVAQPDGYDTVIGERGAKLSGGQRQRITIARAVLKNASILILDEATSALDSEAEKEVQLAIDNVLRNCTSFVVAHRLSTITRCDLICVLEAGRIVESGTHKELLAAEGRYHQLYTSQQAGEGPAAG